MGGVSEDKLSVSDDTKVGGSWRGLSYVIPSVCTTAVLPDDLTIF